MRPFLEPAFGYAAMESLPSERDLFDLLCTFGSFLLDEPVRPGDLVHDGDEGWALAAGASMGLRANGDRTTWELGKLGPVVQHWRPSPAW